MATINITTSGDWDDLTSAAADNDIIIIQSGATASINQTTKFIPNTTNIYDGTVIVNGATGTSPISCVLNTINIGTKGTFKTSLGWWTIGTCHGTAYSDFNLSDYWYKTITGGSRINDVACYLPGLWVETGKELHFTGGTGTLPDEWDYLYNTVNPTETQALLPSAGTNYGPVISTGTVAGDPTTGTIVVKWLLGTNAINNPIEVRKVVDSNGAYYKKTWSGTLSQNPVHRSGVFTEFTNGYNCLNPTTGLYYDTVSTMGNHVMAHLFSSKPMSTTGSFGNGVNGILPSAGAVIKAPIIKRANISTTSRAQGTESNALTTTQIVGVVPGKGVVELNGVLSGSFRLGADTVRLCEANYCAAGFIYLEGYEGSVSGTCRNLILSGQSNTTSYSYNLYLPNTVFSELSCIIPSVVGQIVPYSDNIRITRSLVTNLSHTTSLLKTTIITNAPVRDLQIDKTVFDGRISVAATNLTLKDLIYIPRVMGGTSSNSTQYTISLNGVFGDVYIENIRRMVNGYGPAAPLGITLHSQIDNLKIRAIGHPDFPESFYANAFLTITSNQLASIENLDIARVYLSPYVPSVTGFLGNSVYQLHKWSNITVKDSNFNRSNTSSRTLFNMYPSESGQFYNVMGNNTTTTLPRTRWGPGTLTVPKHYAFSTELSPSSTGQLLCSLVENTSTISNYIVTTLGDGGNTLTYAGNELWNLAANSVIEVTPHRGFNNISSFTGEVSMVDLNSAGGAYDWTGGTVGVDFQYDTAGTGYNGTWLYARTPGNWTGLSCDPTVPVKIKYRLTASSTAADNIEGIISKFNYPVTWYDNLDPIDQTETVITLLNVIAGSRYWIYNADSSVLLTSGVAASSTVSYTATNLPNGTNLTIRVRYASTGTKYLPFETSAVTSNLAATTFVSQVIDTIVT